MKVIRSTKCSLKFANKSKLSTLSTIMSEYGRVVNLFIDHFWPKPPRKSELLKPIVDLFSTWLSYTLRQTAAREAIDMIKAAAERGGGGSSKPTHSGSSMRVSHEASLVPSRSSTEFDAWLHLSCIGNNIILDLPIKFHKHYNELAQRGRRMESYSITREYVQFSFEIETGPKLTGGSQVGLDTGVKALASTSDGSQFGTDIEECVTRINQCKHGSKGQKRARRALKQRMDEVSKEVFDALGPIQLLVVEKLKNLNYKTKVKRRLTKNMRRVIGSWAWRYWLDRVQRECEDRRSTFRSVPAYYTSQTCPSCGLVDKRNRDGEIFLCRGCGHSDNADVNAARNILSRFLTGPYGAGFKANHG